MVATFTETLFERGAANYGDDVRREVGSESIQGGALRKAG
jgi:hypothetical protein